VRWVDSARPAGSPYLYLVAGGKSVTGFPLCRRPAPASRGRTKRSPSVATEPGGESSGYQLAAVLTVVRADSGLLATVVTAPPLPLITPGGSLNRI
jgi:hypothetical protein